MLSFPFLSLSFFLKWSKRSSSYNSFPFILLVYFCFLWNIGEVSDWIHTHWRPALLFAFSVKATSNYHTAHLRLLKALMFVPWLSRSWILIWFGSGICFSASWKCLDQCKNLGSAGKGWLGGDVLFCLPVLSKPPEVVTCNIPLVLMLFWWLQACCVIWLAVSNFLAKTLENQRLVSGMGKTGLRCVLVKPVRKRRKLCTNQNKWQSEDSGLSVWAQVNILLVKHSKFLNSWPLLLTWPWQAGAWGRFMPSFSTADSACYYMESLWDWRSCRWLMKCLKEWMNEYLRLYTVVSLRVSGRFWEIISFFLVFSDEDTKGQWGLTQLVNGEADWHSGLLIVASLQGSSRQIYTVLVY